MKEQQVSDGTIVVVGSLGRDPELKFTTGGRAICGITVAESHRYKSNDEWKEETAWVDVTIWGDLGEHVAASCQKGTRVIVKGRLKQEEWDDKETGKKRAKLTVVADSVGVELRWATAEVTRVERSTTESRSRNYADDVDPFA
jgi:single-strand DNA-binding protein